MQKTESGVPQSTVLQPTMRELGCVADFLLKASEELALDNAELADALAETSRYLKEEIARRERLDDDRRRNWRVEDMA